MALTKLVPTPFGVPATYWNILAIDGNRTHRAAQVTLAGYLDEEARRAGRQPLATLPVTLNGDDFPGGDDGLRYADVYARIRAAVAAAPAGTPLASLSGAEDA